MNQDQRPNTQSVLKTGRQRDRLEELHPGYSDSVSRTITAEDVAAFARLSGDYNALHVDDEFAARTEFEQRVVHGFLHASLLSTLVGMKIPGHGALYLSQSFDFTKPVFIGDTVEARGVVEKVDRATRTLTVETEIINQHGDRVLKGTAKVKVLRIKAEDAVMSDRLNAQFSGDLLKNRTALITGASRGIGRATATVLCQHGAKVYVNYHKSEHAAASLVRELEQRGGSAVKVKADVTQAAEVSRMIEDIGSEDSIDILINNAGPKIRSGSFESFNWDDMSCAHEQIVGSVFHVTQAALPALKACKGQIVNVLSTAALGRTAYSWAPYVSAKAALLALSKNLAQELGPKGVRVNMVSPSMTETDLTTEIPDRIRQMMVSRTPLRRLATPEDVAGAVLLLVSPYANFITGENLLVAGGEVMV